MENDGKGVGTHLVTKPVSKIEWRRLSTEAVSKGMGAWALPHTLRATFRYRNPSTKALRDRASAAPIHHKVAAVKENASRGGVEASLRSCR